MGCGQADCALARQNHRHSHFLQVSCGLCCLVCVGVVLLSLYLHVPCGCLVIVYVFSKLWPLICKSFYCSGTEGMIKTDPVTRKTLSYLPQGGILLCFYVDFCVRFVSVLCLF